MSGIVNPMDVCVTENTVLALLVEDRRSARRAYSLQVLRDSDGEVIKTVPLADGSLRVIFWNGQVIIFGFDVVTSIDVRTGAAKWKTDIPGLLLNRNTTASDADSLFVIGGNGVYSIAEDGQKEILIALSGIPESLGIMPTDSVSLFRSEESVSVWVRGENGYGNIAVASLDGVRHFSSSGRLVYGEGDVMVIHDGGSISAFEILRGPTPSGTTPTSPK